SHSGPSPSSARASTIDSMRSMVSSRLSERDLAAAFQLQDFARLVRRRHTEAEPFEDLPHGAHLLGVAGGEPSGAGPQRILQPDAHVAAHRRGLRRYGQLIAAGSQHRPFVALAK